VPVEVALQDRAGGFVAVLEPEPSHGRDHVDETTGVFGQRQLGDAMEGRLVAVGRDLIELKPDGGFLVRPEVQM